MKHKMTTKIFTTPLLTTAVITALITTQAQAQTTNQCSNNPIKANYKVTNYNSNSKNGTKTGGFHKKGSYSLTIYRSSDAIIYEYPGLQLADVWHNEQQSLELSRYFTHNQRAIDYTSADLNNIGNRNYWEKLYHMVNVSNTDLDLKSNSAKAGCDTTIQYQDDTKSFTFLTAYQLPKTMTVLADGGKYTYELMSIENNNEISNKLKAYQEYDAMDFADIGDNEADPFVSKMINIGFIEDQHNHDHGGDHSDDHAGHSHDHTGHSHDHAGHSHDHTSSTD